MNPRTKGVANSTTFMTVISNNSRVKNLDPLSTLLRTAVKCAVIPWKMQVDFWKANRRAKYIALMFTNLKDNNLIVWCFLQNNYCLLRCHSIVPEQRPSLMLFHF